ncbi:aminodeoxychorismate lyase [Thermotomaculum hydrothermale]|uniref:Endolytic murein transglycosylase n=1 Tax=Thermotomaculum hydrothermale TaxID=981385 RepID=A0A7R6SZ90_9BACT|nr:endolytic transglycosylase MltG [Thermotomaculum hydrothermale]BBB32507.1 aminodeoxychorismate lyase [Thermotomaculum hydrothermale]
MKKIVLISISVIIVLSLLYGFASLFSSKKVSCVIEIKQGESVKSIARQVEEKTPFSSRLFLFTVRMLNLDRKLKAGYYSFSNYYNIIDFAKRLTKGEARLIKVTFPEGFNCFEIFDRLEKSNLGKKEVYMQYFYTPQDFLPDEFKSAKTLEGFLFPDTYLFRANSTEKEIIEQMVSQFKVQFKKAKEFACLKERGIELSDYEVLKLASLVEKETSVVSEMPLIASVFYNRLKKGMRLECDPTIIYALILEGRYDGNIRKKDIRMKHPFNTYYIKGLPPTPIANPGFNAMKAAFCPAVSKYLFFVSNNEGKHLFSETYKQHLKYVKEYQVIYWRRKWKKKR